MPPIVHFFSFFCPSEIGCCGHYAAARRFTENTRPRGEEGPRLPRSVSHSHRALPGSGPQGRRGDGLALPTPALPSTSATARMHARPQAGPGRTPGRPAKRRRQRVPEKLAPTANRVTAERYCGGSSARGACPRRRRRGPRPAAATEVRGGGDRVRRTRTLADATLAANARTHLASPGGNPGSRVVPLKE